MPIFNPLVQTVILKITLKNAINLHLPNFESNHLTDHMVKQLIKTWLFMSDFVFMFFSLLVA